MQSGLMEKRKLVYVAGPLTRGNTLLNIKTACEYADKVWDLGMAVIVPHWNALQELCGVRRDYEHWMSMDFQMLMRCDALLRLPGDSPGSDREVEFARNNNIPVFYSIEELHEWNTLNAQECKDKSNPCRSGCACS